MKYKELIQFDPITTIVKLRDSAVTAKAQKLVSSYVISDTMKERLTDIVFKQIDWTNPNEHKGMLIVGNYGTGKSHLMSFISAIASDAGMVQHVQNADVKTAAAAIAGKFNVIREEIGAVTTRLRQIVVGRLQKHLDDVGVDYTIPTADGEDANNKGWMAEMMKAYKEKFPDKGLLFVLDEMLDYLRSLPEKELVLALGFMRELGEFADQRDENDEPYRFYFIGGVQEAIFDSGRFAFVSDSLGRVAERFKQVKIDRTDVKYVISERLLRKTAAQLQQVETHLNKFSKCYEELTPRIEDFKRMFPVHPDFVSIFEKINCVEKRRILDTLSAKMTALLEKDVPEDEPGLIAFDSYWANVKGDPTARTNGDTKSVIDVVNQLDGKIDHGELQKSYVPMAHRLVDALAVHRLSQDSIDSQIGLTSAEMREMLCVYDSICAEEDDPVTALRDQISVVMKKLMTAVAGQYITKNDQNDQYYIDVKKTVDIEQMIEKKAAGLDDEALDRAYFTALGQILEVNDMPTAVANYKIWEYDRIQWFSHKTFRRGYLFFGAPNERSTAQPPRDYYIYFLHPFAKVQFLDEAKMDEVFFRLEGADDELKKQLGFYAAAMELAATQTGVLKAHFQQKSLQHLQKIGGWLQAKGLDAFSVTYKGEKKKAEKWLTGVNVRDLIGLGSDETINYRDRVHVLVGTLLAGCFEEQAKEYPVFNKYISAEARAVAVKDSLRMVAGTKTKQGAILLDGLKLLDGNGEIVVTDSPYAAKVKAKLAEVGDGKVVNNTDLLKPVSNVLYFDPEKARLEPEMLVLILAALVQSGDVVLSIPGQDFDATKLDELSRCDVDDLVHFKHISKPKGGNVDALTAAFKLLGLNTAYVAQLQQNKPEPVVAFQTKLGQLVPVAAQLINRLGRGVGFLGQDLLAQCHITNAVATVRGAKELLERLQYFNTPAKMLAMPTTKQEIEAQKDAVTLIPALDTLVKFCDGQLQTVGYIDKAAEHSAAGDAWLAKKEQAYTQIKQAIVAVGKLADLQPILKNAQTQLLALESEWKGHYEDLHDRARLSAADEIKKQQVKNSPLLKKLTDLASIEILPKQDLEQLRQTLDAMKVCRDFTKQSLDTSPMCPHCSYSPKNDGTGSTASAVLNGMSAQLEAMLAKWTQTILDNLATPTVREQFELLNAAERQMVESFVQDKILPDPIPMPLLAGLRKVLGGLEKIVVKVDDFGAKLKALGPAEVPQVQNAINDFFADLINGKDIAKVRIVVE